MRPATNGVGRCDLALPSCNQCLRKKRVCSGYRQEEDIVFRTETPQVVRKAKAGGKVPKKNKVPSTAVVLATRPRTPSESASEISYPSVSVQRPSRRVDLHTEAAQHFLAHYYEKMFFGRGGGVDYLTPILEADKARGGPVADVVVACGLATLGSMKNSPDLMMQAYARKSKVLRQLQTQLQDPDKALTHSSVLTCLFLGSFEVCSLQLCCCFVELLCGCTNATRQAVTLSGPESLMAYNQHLKGAVVLTGLRGRSQFADSIGHSLYIRARGMIASTPLSHTRHPTLTISPLDIPIPARPNAAPRFHLRIHRCRRTRRRRLRNTLHQIADPNLPVTSSSQGRRVHGRPHGRASNTSHERLVTLEAQRRRMGPRGMAAARLRKI